MHELVPGADLAALRQIGHTPLKSVGVRMGAALLFHDCGRDLGCPVGAAVGDANHFAVRVALVKPGEERLLEQRLQSPGQSTLLVPSKNANGNPSRLAPLSAVIWPHHKTA